MVIDLIFERSLPDLIEAGGLVEVHSVTIGHDEPVKHDGETCLTDIAHLLGFPQNAGSCGNQQLRMIVGVHVIGDLAQDWPGEITIEPVDQHGFKDSSFENDMLFPGGGIHIHVLVAGCRCSRGRGWLGCLGWCSGRQGRCRRQLLLLRQELILLRLQSLKLLLETSRQGRGGLGGGC